MSSADTPASTPEPSPQSPASPPADGSSPSARPRRKRNWRRILLIAVTCVIALAVIGRIIIAVAFPHVLKKVAAAYDLDASYSRMELYLLSGDVGLWDLTIRPRAGGAPLMTTEYARGDVSTLNLLRGKLAVSRAELDGMQLDVQREADGRIPALEKLLAGGAQPKQSEEEAEELSLDPPLRVDAVRVNRLRAHWVDRSVEPNVDTELAMTVRLSDVGVPGRPTRLLVEGTCPPLLDTLRVEGTASAQGKQLDANFDLLVRGLHPKPAAGYLAPIGIKPIGNSITLTAATEIKTHATGGIATPTTRPADVAGSVIIKDISVTVDGQEAGGVDRLVIDADSLSGAAARLAKVTIDGVRVNASRTAEGTIRFAGLELAAGEPSTQPAVNAGAAAPQTAPATLPAGAPIVIALRELSVRNVRAAFRDDAIMLAAELAFVVDQLAVTGIDSAQPQQLVQIAGEFSSPGMAKSVRLNGSARPFAVTRTLDAKLVARGIRPDAIKGYLDALGIESTFTDGTFTTDLRAALSLSESGTIDADARLADISLGDAAGELLALDAAHVSGVSIDPANSRVRVEAVDLAGPRFAARRAADGTVSAAGLRTKPPAPTKTSAPAANRASTPPPASSPALPASSSPLPKLELGRLTWKGVDVQLVDEAVTPVTNVRINNAGVELANIVVDLDPPGPIRHAG